MYSMACARADAARGSYRASWGDYVSWLNRYSDYGMAPAVHDRAMDRARAAPPGGTRAPDAGGHGRTPARHLPSLATASGALHDRARAHRPR
jgi:hypothetical protein